MKTENPRFLFSFSHLLKLVVERESVCFLCFVFCFGLFFWSLVMAPSFDYAVSSLLCGEDNSIFDDNDYGVVVEEFEATWHHLGHRSRNQDRGFGGGGGSDGVPLQSDECLALMVEKECQYLPGGDYLKKLLSGDLDLGARKQAVDWIGKVGFCLAFCFCCVNERVYALYVHVCF